ncbi:MAG: DinB family protein [Balneolaceae bacterium]|nr:DinB family protein [Balneolaceae bacterium]
MTQTQSDTDDRYTYQWFIDRFREAGEQAVRFCRPIEEGRFLTRPAEKIWSAGECYDHLNTFGDRYVDSIRTGLKRGSDNRAEPGQSFKPGWIAGGVAWFFEPPYSIKIKTLRPFKPQSAASLEKERVLNAFTSLQDTLIESLEEARDRRLVLDKCHTSHPLFNWISMTVAECFAIVEVHQRRHMWQAEQVLKHLNETVVRPS